MSTDIGLFEAPPDHDARPQFARVLMGYDPRDVEAYLTLLRERFGALERELQAARVEAEAMRRRHANARKEAFAEAATRMAEVVRAADLHADRIRREAQEEAESQLSEARLTAERLRREAEAERERLRSEARRELDRVRGEAGRVLGELSSCRVALVDELERLREHLLELADQVEAVTVGDATEEGQDGRPLIPGPDDLLASLEGFDLLMESGADEDDDDPGEDGED